ncbi:MAG: PspC domain-containing protein [Streptococcaceae bacterium]|nr:PspC domain-containing protein [Streptococcaceae bacterium]
MSKTLTKSSSNRMISGVVGGIGEYFGLDENVITIIRIVWAVITLMGAGSPIIIYIILAVIMPSAGSRKPYQRSSHERPWENGAQNFYQSNPNTYQTDRKIKEAEPVNDDDNWSDF